jgi:competence protein ComEC
MPDVESGSPARVRAVCAWGAVALGVYLSSLVTGPGSVLWLAGASGASVAAMFVRGWWCRGALLVALVLFGAGWGTLRLNETGDTSLERVVEGMPDGVPMRITGVVTTPVTPVEGRMNPLAGAGAAHGGWRFEVRVRFVGEDAGAGPVSGRLVVVSREEPGVAAGDWVVVAGRYRAIPGALNPGESDRARWARSRGVAGYLDVPRASLVWADVSYADAWERAASLWHGWRGNLRIRAEGALERATRGLDESGRVLVHSLVLGRPPPGGVEPGARLRDSFTRLGLAHVLALSGFHLVVLVAVMLRVVRATGDVGRWESVAVAAMVGLYLLLVPSSAPIVRAGVLALALVAADAMGKRYDRLTILAWSALGLALWRPAELWSLGYQLSCGLTAVLMGLGGRVHARIFPPPIRTGTAADLRFLDPSAGRRAWNEARGLFSTTLLCWLAATPLVLWRTGLLTPLAVPSAMVVVPLAVVLLATGFAALLLGLLSPVLAVAVSWPLEWSARLCVGAVERLDSIPGSAVLLPPVSIAWASAATVVLLWWLGWARRGAWRGVALTGLLAAWGGAEWRWAWRPSDDVALRIDALAVGDGSAMLIRSGGECMLWDCGSPSPSAGRLIVRRAVRSLGEVRVPTVVLTHPDADHFSALWDVAGPLGVRRAVVSGRFIERARVQPGGTAARALRLLGELGVEVVTLAAGDRLLLGEAAFEILSPPEDAAWAEDNEHSLVAWAWVEGRGVLLTGDVQESAIGYVWERHPGLAVDVAEAPHHGSAAPGAVEWLTALSPTVVVQSSASRRADDPRWAASRERSAWLVTGRDGAAWVEVRRGGRLGWGSFRWQPVEDRRLIHVARPSRP